MRWWLTVLVLVGCGSESEQSGNRRCEEGPEIAYAAIREFTDGAPGCSSDAECVMFNDSLECDRFSMGTCGNVVHRDTLASWDPDTICDEIEKLPGQRGIACASTPSCASFVPACVQGRCGTKTASFP